MKLLRLLMFVVGIFVFIVCFVLLLNITAPNPTHRRYASANIFMPPPGANDLASIKRAGNEGEAVLSKDLRVVNNNAPDQGQCFCKGTSVNPFVSCVKCVVTNTGLPSDRIPDFVTDSFIADAKNKASLDSGDLSQFSIDATVAQALKRTLWIYVRTDTVVDPRFEQMAEGTGGAVVYYFTKPGFIDPMDQDAGDGLLASSFLVLATGVWELRLHRQKPHQVVPINPVKPKVVSTKKTEVPNGPSQLSFPNSWNQPPPSDNPQPYGPVKPDPVRPSHSPDPMSDALDAIKRAEEAAKHTRSKID